MLKKRLITVLTFNDGVLFRTRSFIPDYRYTLSFVDAWSVDEIAVLNVTRPRGAGKENFEKIIQQFARKCFVPLAAGGCIKTIEDVKRLLRIGADKVIIDTEAFERPEFITEIAKQFGAQCAVVCIDAKKKPDGTYEVYTDFGTKPTGMDPVTWAKKAQQYGAGEIIIQSIDKDGTLEGYDNELNRLVADAVDIPILVCGGAGAWNHFVDGFQKGHASAVCTTNIYHFTETSIKSAKAFLKNAGIDVRTD
jgi:cyclase